MLIKVYALRLKDVEQYCLDNNVKPSFYNKIVEILSTVQCDEMVDIKTNILEDICKWCENENICDNLEKYDDFYYKFKRIIDDINFEKRSLFDLYN